MENGIAKKQHGAKEIKIVKVIQDNGKESTGCHIYLPGMTTEEANNLVAKILKEYMEENVENN